MLPLPALSLHEQRIIGTLAEKQRTVPDTYPLSLNTLLAGCNQKTSRHPVIEMSESDALVALDRLMLLGLVSTVSGSRVARYAHHLDKVLGIPSQASALLTVLLLRGPQTAGELRLNTDRLHSFADISSVEAFLSELAERSQGALVIELPKAPGARENRWMHLLGGEVTIDPPANSKMTALDQDLLAGLIERVTQLETEVSELKAALKASTTPDQSEAC